MTSLMARLARVMDLGSHLLATAPKRFPGRVVSELAHPSLEGTDMQRVIASRRAALSLVEDVPAARVQGWQVARTGIGYLVCTHYYAQVLKKKREEEHEEQPSH